MPSDYTSKSALLDKFTELKKSAPTLKDAIYLDGVMAVVDTAQTLDLVPAPVKCGECVYWQDRQIQMEDGACRDYGSDDEQYVDITKGINVGSHCTLHGFENKSGSWFWSKVDDYCSRGKRKDDGEG